MPLQVLLYVCSVVYVHWNSEELPNWAGCCPTCPIEIAAEMSTEVIRYLCIKWKHLLHLELSSSPEIEEGQQHCTHQSSVLAILMQDVEYMFSYFLVMNYRLDLLSAITERNAAIHDKCVAGNFQSSCWILLKYYINCPTIQYSLSCRKSGCDLAN